MALYPFMKQQNKYTIFRFYFGCTPHGKDLQALCKHYSDAQINGMRKDVHHA